MWLEQKIYGFQCENGIVNQEDILGDIFLRVNGNKTNVSLFDLFSKISEEIEFDETTKVLEIKGYSILERIVIETKQYAVSNEKSVTIDFHSDTLGEISLSFRKTPLVQWSDKKISEDVVAAFDKKIIELSEQDDQGSGSGTPHSEPEPIFNAKFENNKARYLNSGYKEFIDGNFHLLLKSETNSAILVEILNENELNMFSEVEKTTENVLRFVKNDRKINAKLIENLLKIEEIQS